MSSQFSSRQRLSSKFQAAKFFCSTNRIAGTRGAEPSYSMYWSNIIRRTKPLAFMGASGKVVWPVITRRSLAGHRCPKSCPNRFHIDAINFGDLMCNRPNTLFNRNQIWVLGFLPVDFSDIRNRDNVIHHGTPLSLTTLHVGGGIKLPMNYVILFTERILEGLKNCISRT